MRNLLSLLLAFATATTASAATYHMTAPYSQKISIGGDTLCGNSLYDPDVFMSADGRLNVMAQGGDLDAWNGGMDSLYRSLRDYNGVWSSIADGSAPSITGPVSCDLPNHLNPDPSGPLASPSFVAVDGRQYVAYVGGNADLERGRIYWARVMSSDGGYLEVFPSVYTPTAIIQPTGSGHTFCEKHGIGQVNVVYEGGWFYFFLHYYHFLPGQGDGPRRVYAYRIAYDANSTWGLGSTRQLWNPSTGWTAHNGNLVFDYEGGPTSSFSDYGDYRNFAHSTGDVEWNPERNAWIHVFTPGSGGGYQWQETTSVANGTWSTPVVIDDSALRAQYPNSGSYGPGIWYGDLTNDAINNPVWYIWTPIDKSGCGDWAGLLGVSQLTFY